MTITLPALPLPNRTNVTRLGFDVRQRPPFGGLERNFMRPGSRHQVDWDLPTIDATCAHALIAAKLKARATGDVVRAVFPQPAGLAPTITGVTVRGASQTGRLLNITGLPTTAGRTNKILRARELDNAAWIASQATVSANAIAGPTGGVTAEKIVETATTNVHSLAQLISQSTAYSFSTYLKAAERTWGWLSDSSGVMTFFNLATGVVGTVGAGYTAAISDAGGGWYRCSISQTPGGTRTNFKIGIATADGVSNYAGDITKGIYATDVQLEDGALSAFILTTSAAVTVYSTIIKAGCALSFIVSSRSYLYIVTDDVMGSASADGQVALDCLLRASPANATAIEFVAPIIEGWLQGDESWSTDRLTYSNFTMSIAEAA